MNSREFDSMLDDLLRQAFYPFAEAEPPVRVWRRVLRAIRAMRAELRVSPAQPIFAGFLAWVKTVNVTYVPLFSNRAYYVDQNGRSLPSPFWDIALTQMFDLRLAS